jgi:hypothetical protein
MVGVEEGGRTPSRRVWEEVAADRRTRERVVLISVSILVLVAVDVDVVAGELERGLAVAGVSSDKGRCWRYRGGFNGGHACLANGALNGQWLLLSTPVRVVVSGVVRSRRQAEQTWDLGEQGASVLCLAWEDNRQALQGSVREPLPL